MKPQSKYLLLTAGILLSGLMVASAVIAEEVASESAAVGGNPYVRKTAPTAVVEKKVEKKTLDARVQSLKKK